MFGRCDLRLPEIAHIDGEKELRCLLQGPQTSKWHHSVRGTDLILCETIFHGLAGRAIMDRFRFAAHRIHCRHDHVDHYSFEPVRNRFSRVDL